MNVLQKVLTKRGIVESDLIPYKAPKLDFPMLQLTVQDLFGLFFTNPSAVTGILYDVDVDGLFSGAMLKDFFLRLRRNAPLTTMNKQKQHGITKEVIEWVKENHIEWLFVVDAGSGDHEAHAELSAMGVHVVVLDHHPYAEPPTALPNVWIVNPINSPHLPKLSGGGVVYRFIEQVAELLAMDVQDYETLVGVTVLSDMCSMTDAENRYYVTQLYANYPKNLLFKTIHEAGHFYGSKQSLFTFKIIPFLNALIRIGQEETAMELANNMHRHATMRRVPNMLSSVKTVQEDFKSQVRNASALKIKPHAVALLRKAEDSMAHLTTVNGLLGNELTSEHKKDALVLAFHPSRGVWKGSFRGVNATYDDLRAYGFTAMGHPQACGVEVTQENLKRFLNEYVPTVQKKRIADIDVESGQLSSSELLEIATFNELTGTNLQPIRFNMLRGMHNVEETVTQGKREILMTAHEQIIDFGSTESTVLVIQPSLSNYEEAGYQLLRQY